MPSKHETLEILNKKKQYEDAIEYDLHNYFIDCLPDITDLTDEEKDEAGRIVHQIAIESKKHSYIFQGLIRMVFENAEDKY